MPACLTHYYFARTVAQSLGAALPQDAPEYIWGAQGPDFLFCHRFFPWMKGRSLKEYGSRLHSEVKPSVTFSAMREFLSRHRDPGYRAYVTGFVCHYALDSTAHPYVNALATELAAQRPWETVSTMHGEVEASLDAIILRRETGMLPSQVNVKQMFPKNESAQRRIAKLYQAVLLSACGEDVPEGELLRATNDAHFVFSLLNDRTGLKRQLFQRVEKGKPSLVTSHIVPITEEDGVDFANIQHSSWGDPPSKQSFFDLFDQAIELAKQLITRFDTCDFAALTGERPFG